MNDPDPKLFSRLTLAFRSFWRILGNRDFAQTVAQDEKEMAALEGAGAPKLATTTPDAALLLLGLLQENGRFVDFMQQDVAQFSDEEVGGAARVVHAGCRRVLAEHFDIAPVLEEAEGASVTLEPGFDASIIRPTGNLVGEPPFVGKLIHPGWRVKDVRLPRIQRKRDLAILAAAEVEL